MQTTHHVNFGKLNHYLNTSFAGARVQHAGREYRGQRRAARRPARVLAAGGARPARAPRVAARPARLQAAPTLLLRVRTGNTHYIIS